MYERHRDIERERAKESERGKKSTHLAPVMMAVGGWVESGVAATASVGAAAARTTVVVACGVLGMAPGRRAALRARQAVRAVRARGAAAGQDVALGEFVATDAARATRVDATMDIVMRPIN